MAKKKATKTAKKKPTATKLLSFQEALVKSDEVAGKRHLMLGNGFSIALFPDIFTYGTLFDRAKESNKLSQRVAEVFDLLGTTDFEKVMEALQDASALVRIYATKSPQLAAKLQGDAEKLRDILAETISENHPERPYEVTPTQYASCKRFLSDFNGNIYSLNYDLLLYWTLMQDEVLPAVESDDGFRDSEEHSGGYVVWDVQNSGRQRIYFLHGALHVFDAGAELKKFVWSKTEIALIDQIKRSLVLRHYPLIVTEGTSEQKMNRIQHSGFLNRAYRSFAEIGGSLFIYGHSLAENDEHLLKLIDGGKTKQVFVGIYGDQTSKNNRQIIERANSIPRRRRDKYPAEVLFFDAHSAQVWGRPATT